MIEYIDMVRAANGCQSNNDCPWGSFCNDSYACEIDPVCDIDEITGCTSNDDCMKVAKECCDCLLGGAETAVHTDYTDVYHSCKFCPAFNDCSGPGNCTNRIPICDNGTCALADPPPGPGTSPADIDGDGDVDMTDYYWFVQDYLDYKNGNGLKERSDLNDDQVMSMLDYSIFVEEYLLAKL